MPDRPAELKAETSLNDHTMLLQMIFSFDFLLLLFSCLIAYILLYYIRLYVAQKTGRIPPGPWGLPVVGFLPFASKLLHEQLAKMKSKYGPVIQLQLGNYNVLVLNDAASIREALKQTIFSGRPDTLTMRLIREAGEKALIFRTADASWKLLRRASVRALSLFSTSKNSALEHVTQNAVETLKQKLIETEGKPIELREPLFTCTATVISCLCFGREPRVDDPLSEVICK